MIRSLHFKLDRSIKKVFGSNVARRFIREQDGATMVEFAMVVAPFLAMTFAILQTALVFFAGQTMETAGADSARLIMTGQAQGAGFNQSQFKDAVCAKIRGVFNCASGLYVDVKTYTAFSSIDNSKLPVDSNGNLQTSSFTYQPGGPGDIVVVRLIYQWPVYLPLLGLADASGSTRIIMSTMAFRNEPYS